MAMTSRERTEAAFRHMETDRTPMFEYVLLSPIADQLLGRPYAGDSSHWADTLAALGWKDAVRQIAIDLLDLASLLGHDLVYSVPNPEPPNSHPDPHPSRPKPDDPVERVRHRLEIARETDPCPPDSTFFIYQALKEEMTRRGMDLPILAPGYRHGVWTDTDLMITMLADPDTAHAHFDRATQESIACVERFASLGVDIVGVGGDFAGNRPLISPEAYRTYIMPEVRKVSRRVHASGLWAVNASDGNLWSVIDDYLYGCEVDGYLEIDMQAGMDLRSLKASHGSRITFLGNLDCGNTLSFGTPEQVRQHTLDCIEAGMGQGGHILCASNAITASIPIENYLAVLEAYRGRFGLPLLNIP